MVYERIVIQTRQVHQGHPRKEPKDIGFRGNHLDQGFGSENRYFPRKELESELNWRLKLLEGIGIELRPCHACGIGIYLRYLDGDVLMNLKVIEGL